MEDLDFLMECLEIDMEANDRSRGAKGLKAQADSRKIKIRSFNTGDNIDEVLKANRTPRQQRLAIRRQKKNRYVKNQIASHDHLGLYDDITNTVYVNKKGVKDRRATASKRTTYTPRYILMHELRHAKQNALARSLGGVQNVRRMNARSVKGDDYYNRPLEHDAFSVENGKDAPGKLNKIVRSTVGYKKRGKRVGKLKFSGGKDLMYRGYRRGYRTYGPPEDFSGTGWD